MDKPNAHGAAPSVRTRDKILNGVVLAATPLAVVIYIIDLWAGQ